MAKITALEFDHEWTNSFGTMYDFNISFDDGRSGQVSAKSQNPSYKVGDEVEVEVKRESEHGMVFKVSKGGFNKPGQPAPARNGQAAPRAGGWTGKTDNSFDIRVGRCMNNAVLLHCHKSSHGLSVVDLADKLFKDEMELIKRNAPAPAPAPAAQPRPAQQQPAQQAQPEPEPEEEEVLPF